jgi:hypothetical protein
MPRLLGDSRLQLREASAWIGKSDFETFEADDCENA